MYQVIILTGADPSAQWASLSEKYRTNNASIPPLGAFNCANALRACGISCLVVNHAINYSIAEINQLLDNAVDDNTLMIGISTTFWSAYNNDNFLGLNPNGILDKFPYWNEQGSFDQQVLHRLREKFTKLKFISGGFNINVNQEINGLDFMCVGYSEVSIVNIAKHLLSGSVIPNSRKNIFGTTIVDDREAATYDFANTHVHWLPEDVVNHTKLPIGIGRGCIFNCNFCSFPMRGKHNLDHIRTADSIISELQFNYDSYNITKYIIVDDTFNDSREKLISMRDAIKKLNFQPYFWCYARLDLVVTRIDTLDILYEIGVRSMYFGIESFTKKTALALGKGLSSDKQIDTINFIKEKYPEITLHGNFIVGGPYESIEEVTNTAKMLSDGKVHLDSWKFNAMYIHPNLKTSWPSEFDLNWAKYGYRKKDIIADVLIWESDYMDFYQAKELSIKFGSSEYRKSNWGHYYQMTEWYVENEDKSVFLPKYKSQLLNIVSNK
jgi:radical SAM superfamily enzyme YgiQ (UPF0313 family)